MKRLENMYVCMTAIQERTMHNQAGFGREGFARMLVMKLYSCVQMERALQTVKLL